MSNDNGHRWSKFWWRDWQNDQELRQCSLAAQGLWMRLLCMCFESQGRLLVHGIAPSYVVISQITTCRVQDVKRYLAELLAHSVARQDDDGVIYCQRMVNDFKASNAGREAVSKRYNGPTPTRVASTKPRVAPKSPPRVQDLEEKRKEREENHFDLAGKEASKADPFVAPSETENYTTAPLSAEIERRGNPDDGTPSLDEIMRRRQAAHAEVDPLSAALGRSLRHVEYAPGQRPRRSRQEQKNEIMPQPKPTPAHLDAENLRIARRIAGIPTASLTGTRH